MGRRLLLRYWKRRSALLYRLLPFLSWRITATDLRADAMAGLSVALVAIPQSLAYAQLAGLPAYYGLYAALLPTVVGALFGSSAQLSTGPVALTSLLTAASLAPFAAGGSPGYIELAVLLALLSGVFQLAFGLMRLGVLMNLLSHPVLIGFINAAAVLIALSQLPALLGIPVPSASGHVVVDAWRTVMAIGRLHWLSAGFAAGAIALLMLLTARARRLPGVLLVAALFTVLSYAIDFPSGGGRVVGVIPAGLPALDLPSLRPGTITLLLPAAFAIAVISFMEAMSSAKIAAIRTARRWDENQELVGQGLAKIAAAFSGTMPVSGSFSRSALNLAAGARTGLSSVVSAGCVLATLLFLTPLLQYLPVPVLAAFIVLAVANLVNVRSLLNSWRASRDDGVAATITFGATLAFAPHIENGIVAGILVSLGLFIFRRMGPDLAVIGTVADTGIGSIRFDASLVFVNVSYFENAILQLERRQPRLRFIVVSAQGINALDASGVEMLRSLAEGLGKKGIGLAFVGVKPQVRSVMQRTGLAEKLGAENFFDFDAQAREALLSRIAQAPPPEP